MRLNSDDIELLVYGILTDLAIAILLLGIGFNVPALIIIGAAGYVLACAPALPYALALFPLAGIVLAFVPFIYLLKPVTDPIAKRMAEANLKRKYGSCPVPWIVAKAPWESNFGIPFDPIEDIRRAKDKALMETGIMPNSIYFPFRAEAALLRYIKVMGLTRYADELRNTWTVASIEGLKIVNTKWPTELIDPCNMYVYRASDDESEIFSSACVIQNAVDGRGVELYREVLKQRGNR